MGQVQRSCVRANSWRERGRPSHSWQDRSIGYARLSQSSPGRPRRATPVKGVTVPVLERSDTARISWEANGPDDGQAVLLIMGLAYPCLLYTSDAADDLTRVDLGGRRIIKK